LNSASSLEEDGGTWVRRVQVVGREDYMRFSQAISRARAGYAKGGGSEVSELAGDIGARKTKIVMSHERREQRFRKCATQNSLTFFQIFGTFAFYSSRNTRST